LFVEANAPSKNFFRRDGYEPPEETLYARKRLEPDV